MTITYNAPLGPRLTLAEVAAVAQQEAPPELADTWHVVNATAVAWAESAGWTMAVRINQRPGTESHLSMDLGLWQLNEHWNRRRDPSFSPLMAFTPEVAAGVAYSLAQECARIYGTWRADWRWWTVWRTAAARSAKLQGECRRAVNTVRAAEGRRLL